ncbi:HD-GYP domain-containing protein [Methylobacterium sp. JK268]
MADGFILLIADAFAPARRLADGLARLAPCLTVGLEDPLPNGQAAVAVVPLGRAEVADPARLRRSVSLLRARGIAGLGLARDQATLEVAREIGFAKLLPASAPWTTIAAAVTHLLAAHKAARASGPDWLVRARAAEADHLVHRVFAAAADGAPPSPQDVDTGTEIVLDAVSEGGIRAWLDVIRHHQVGVYQHSLGVAGYAGALAARLGFRHRDELRLVRAALLHDVGKSRIPLAILDKPSGLSEQEMAVMRTHPVLGADLLAGQPGFDAETLDAVRHHHELLDGSGYPDGLAGAAIGDLVRLVTICDIFSALTERRPYRSPMRAAEAWGVMEAMGPKLDADLLAAFRVVALASETADAT